MKSILVTGASGNLGQAVVHRFLAEGHKVYAALGLGEDSRVFAHSSEGARVETQFLNLTDETVSDGFVKSLISKDPAVDTAICLVGGWQPGGLSETTGYELDKMIKLNFITAYNVARPMMEFFERQGRGQFVFVGARPAINPAEGKNAVAYALSKALLFHLAEIINDQGKFKNIRASVIVPSTLDTPQNRAAMPDADRSDWVTPESAAETISFLLSETGSNMRETVLKIYNKA